ncbi:P-loop containing nucleoside triphosphate hydrolase protein [Hypoxylon trugodes]|uniref:P-loop containing nucleoside triphosphate hydrolase protein n=1 Tax=Hypoxylon trugodes TaxID=326681 RepID=UPI00219EE9CB|nr:P-loop containing nucleoside triphosphate hydrolase protein [Hypoxylon trugodes]KAI1390675.1 P-loop containing nucleoside triphosphate hydrolase protein [Hypoxylon trugodes]
MEKKYAELGEGSEKPHDEASTSVPGPVNQDIPIDHVLQQSSTAAEFPRVDTSGSISIEANPPSPSIVRESSTMDLLGASAPPGRTASISSQSSSAFLSEHGGPSRPTSEQHTISVRPSLSALPQPPESQAGGTTLSPIPSASPGNSIGPASPINAFQPTPPAAATTAPIGPAATAAAAAAAVPPTMQKPAPSTKAKLKKTSSNFIRIFGYTTWRDRAMLSLSVAAAMGAGVAYPLMTLVFGQLVGSIANARANLTGPGAQAHYTQLINQYVLFMVYLFIGRFVLGYVATLGFRIMSLRISSAMRLAYFKSLIGLPVSLLDTQPPGQVAAIITTTANTLQNGISERLAAIIQNLSMFVSAIVIAYSRSWKLSLVTSSGLLLITICYCITIPFVVKNMKQVEDANIKGSAVASEAFSSIRMVAAYGAELKMVKKYKEWVDEAQRRGLRLSKIVAVQQGTIYFSVYGTFALTFWFAVKLLVNLEIDSVGTLITVLMCIMTIVLGIGGIAAPISAAARAAGAASILFNGIDAPRPVTTGLKAPDVSAAGDIVLWGVNFTYPTRPKLKVLDGLNLVLPAGKITAIVGPSGSGKSTIVALIERWYELDGDNEQKKLVQFFRNGTIKVGDTKLIDIDQKWWRSQIGLVQQEPFLFNTTIFQNVANGLIGTEWEEAGVEKKRELVEQACKEAFADEFISRLPDGYDTHVGDAGIRLSGGQRQRLAIARAIVKQPKILILDEATSSIDVRGEKVVQAALDKVSKNRTTIMIAHRLSTVKKADNIVVLAKGKVVQWGNHESLMAKGEGPYWALTTSQQLSMGESTGDSIDTSSEVTEVEKRTMDIMTLDESKAEIRDSESTVVDEPKHKPKGILGSFGALLLEQKPFWPWYVWMLLGAVIAGGSPPVQAFIFAALISSFAYWGDVLIAVTDFWCLMFVALAGAAGIGYFSLGYSSTVVSFYITSTYRREYFENIVSKAVSWFDGDGRSIGALTGIVASDPTQLQQLLGNNMAFAFISIFSVIGCLTISFYFGWKLTIVALSSAMPLAVAAGFFRVRVEKKFEAMNLKVFSESAKFATESIGAIRTVTALTLEDSISRRYEDLLDAHVTKAFKRARYATLVFSASDSLSFLCMAFVLWYGGTLLVAGEYQTFQYLVVYIAVVQGATGAGQWLSFGPNIAQATAAANRIQAMRNKEGGDGRGITLDEVVDEEKQGVKIELRDVWFRYPTRDVPVLNGLSMTIERGQFAAVVGPSGCGKTSVISLLERFYNVKSGSITYNDIDIDNIDLRDYRKTISLVAQEPSLFNGTIRENILLGVDPDSISAGELEQVCRDAEIHDFISSLPEGYNTKVGIKGILLSGGQKQRISIARALIRNPRLLLLDEATSNLDSHTEKLVQSVFEKTKKNRTMIVVAHRLATIQNADVIFVLGDGQVLESGTHIGLLQKRGVYYGMCQAQALDR